MDTTATPNLPQLFFLNQVNSSSWVDFVRMVFLNDSQALPGVILVVSLISAIGAFLNLYLKDFPVPLPVVLFLIGCSFEILSFTSDEVRKYVDAIQWMNPELFFGMFTPVIIFNVAFDMDIYMLQKLLWQILLITIPGFLMNYLLVLWYLSSINNLFLKTIPWLLFTTILVSSDPMLTTNIIKEFGISRTLANLISGESLMTSIVSFIVFSTIIDVNTNIHTNMNQSLAFNIFSSTCRYCIASFFIGIISSRLMQLWISNIFEDDVNHISLTFSVLYLIFYISELIKTSGIFALAIMGLSLNSISFKPGLETLIVKFWNCVSFVAFLMVFTFIGLLIPAHTYLYITFSDIYYAINIYFTLIVLRLLVLLLLSPLLSRFGHGFSWRWAFVMVWSEMKGTPNINLALLLAYSDISLGTEREKSQILFHGMLVCLINLIVGRFILPVAVNKFGFRNVRSTKYKSLYYTFQHFQELTKSTVSALKFDKDLANADWNIVEKAIILQNPYVLTQEDLTEHQKVKCPDCNKEIDGSLNIEAMELANRRILSAQIASYQRQYRDEILCQSAVQVLVGAAGSFGEKGEYMSPKTIKDYYEHKKLLGFIRRALLNWVYNTKKDKGVPSRYFILRICHKIVFTEEFEYIGYLMTLMNMFPILISWIFSLNEIYIVELVYCNYSFLMIYILESLLKVAAMRKEYFAYAWNMFELVITLFDIMDITFNEIHIFSGTSNLIQSLFIKTMRSLRILRILKLITPKLLQITDKKMSHQLSTKYAILKGYVQGELDIITIIDKIASSKEIKQVLLRRVTGNTVKAMKELGYLEYDHPEIAVTMKTKEQINAMLSLAREIVKSFRLKGNIHKLEYSGIIKLITTKKRELLEFQQTIKPLTGREILCHIPWLDKDLEGIQFIEGVSRTVTFDCGNDIFIEGDKPKGIYVIISGMVQLKRSKPGLGIDQTFCESEDKDDEIIYTDYVIHGGIIGELNCLTNEPMKYSATCKTVVEVRKDNFIVDLVKPLVPNTCFIPKSNLYEFFEQCPNDIEYKMWLKLGLSITARKIKERLSYKDWNYKMQLKLCNGFIKDVPMNTKTDIYDETVIYVILIHGAVEDCQLRKAYKTPSLIPITCHQIQGIEDLTKIMVIKTSIDIQKFKWDHRKFVSSRRRATRNEDLSLSS